MAMTGLRGIAKAGSFAQRFAILVREFGSRYRLSRASGVPESTLQEYSRRLGDLPPRADILFKLARAANVSFEWLATGKGEMRPPGLLPGAAFADVVMVEMRDPNAALPSEQILGHVPFSRAWLERRLGLSDQDRLMVLEADQELPPLIGQSDLLLVDRTAGKKLPRRDGIYVLSVARGLAIRLVSVQLNGTFLVSSPATSEHVAAMDIESLVVGEIVWRGGRL
ncbi:MAG TPA: helix-turn-helix domain-containing protein [Candidatus Binataceae bacterium]|nr:helix-turn-helix domain-containing protein [Candidatus Binataceae bacterium]